MSWKYATYSQRDLPSSRGSSQVKLGLYNSKATAPSDSKFYRDLGEPVEHSPVWAKTNVGEPPTSVQRLQKRYGVPSESRTEMKAYRKAETKDLSGSVGGRVYGRTLTSLNLVETGDDSRFRRRPVRNSDSEKVPGGTSPSEGRKFFYVPTATTRSFGRKYTNDSSPTTSDFVGKDTLFEKERSHENEDMISVVTRGTSPTPTSSSVYLRSKRTDYGLEKKIAKPRRKPETVHKETQTERELSTARYGVYGEGRSRSPWSAYGGSSCNSKYLGRSSYSSDNRLGTSDFKREDSDYPTTPESPIKTFVGKPPALIKTPPTSPVKEPEKKTFCRKSPPTNIRSPLKLDCAKTELAKNPISPTRLSSPLQCKILTSPEAVSPQGRGPSPKVTIDRCPDINPATIDDVSSLSESSEEETSSDEEPDEPLPAAAFVKKSVTNFLQNIPNHLPLTHSKANLHQKPNALSPQKVKFMRIESGERAWWLESSDKIPEGIARTKSIRSVSDSARDFQDHKPTGNALSPPYLINRQFSGDKDWLRENGEDVIGSHDPLSPKDERPGKIPATGNCHAVPNGNENFVECEPLPKRDYSKSPEIILTEEKNPMKFNQQADEYLTEFQRECTVRDIAQKLQNGLGSPHEDKNFLEPGDATSKAKAALAKSKTKLDIKRSASREMSPKVLDTKSEIDLYWKELADSLNRPLKLCDLDFTDLNSDDETDIFGNSTSNGEIPPPPPPMLILPVPRSHNVPAPPHNAPSNPTSPRSRVPAPPPAPQIVKNKKTVKLFWKEVKDEPVMQAKIPDGVPLIWDELAKVKVDTQKLEFLFESRAKDLMSKKQQEQNKNRETIVLDPKRSNAINIGMTKLPPPRAIKTAILKMDATVVNKEGIEKILTMLPTEEEKLRIQEAQAANPDVPLGSAEQFLLTLASISELEARLRLWAFKLNFENNEKEICEPLMDLKQGMEILKGNKTFRGILSTLLSVGNFLNGYDVKGFQIEYLSKVPEVKDTVHKHSLLHHLCIIVMDKFPESTDLYSEIGAVTRASKVDFDELNSNIKKLEEECKLSWNYLKMIAKHEGHTAMKVKMSDFLADCAERIIVVTMVHRRIMSRFRKFAFWLGIPAIRISTTRPNEIFKIISEFALEYRTTRERVLQQIRKLNREKSRIRGYLTADSDGAARKMNSKEAKDDARLKQLLQEESTCNESLTNTSSWRRQRRDTKTLLQEVNNNDEEILDALIKTANQVSSPRLKERRRSRIYGKCCKFNDI